MPDPLSFALFALAVIVAEVVLICWLVRTGKIKRQRTIGGVMFIMWRQGRRRYLQAESGQMMATWPVPFPPGLMNEALEAADIRHVVGSPIIVEHDSNGIYTWWQESAA